MARKKNASLKYATGIKSGTHIDYKLGRLKYQDLKDGEIEIDNDAKISLSTGNGRGANGAWVGAWVYIYSVDVPRLTEPCKCKESANAKS